MTELFNAIARNLILPPASLLLLTAIGLLLRRRWRRAGGIVAGAALVLLVFLSSSAGARFLVAPLEALATPLRDPANAGAQAIVVLAAGRLRAAPEYGDRDIPDHIALARLRYAAHLHRRTGLPILVSGGAPSAGATSLADAMASALREDFGVPVRWVEGRSRNTAENAAFSAALLRPENVERVLLVTDAMHMERARTVFQGGGLQVTDAPTMFFGEQARGLVAWVPSAEGMRRSWYASYELIGIAWYRLKSNGSP
ncbi:YdcF family protein [Massilia sp. CFBP9012]|uniref:YdcF family protein n=1 Tax=Massilia sp. CFBP9012 TaxID=3096531 RepID=UPI002A6B84C5|nr:YdcF family protein [Massilia sp. CFBP9012]MDY0975119.1 YdcF family protein [Massilia sp. CFBP9012]